MRKAVISLLIGTFCAATPLKAESEDSKGSVKYVNKATPTHYGRSSAMPKWQKAAIAIGIAAVAVTTVVLVANHHNN